MSLCCELATAAIGHNGGMSGKFRNLTNRRLKLYWVDFDGKPNLNSVLDGNGGIMSFQTYVGHSFFWGEYHGKPVPLTSKGVSGAEFTIAADQLVYIVSDNTANKKVVADAEKEIEFLKDYNNRTGRDWLANYPRKPPVMPMRKCTTIGEQIKVPISEDSRKFICNDGSEACRSQESSVTLACISITPCAWEIKEFLSDFEADYIVDYAEPNLRRSGLVGGVEQMVDVQRTSMSYRMNRKTSNYVDAIYRRAADALDIPESILTNDKNAEPLDVLRYLNAQKYQPHFDWYVSGLPESRFVSFLMYLNTPPQGGATKFPNGIAADGSQGVSVQALKRNAFFFYNMLEDGNVDDFSLHEGTPVTVGPKWLATIWVWDPKQSGHSYEATEKEIQDYRQKKAEEVKMAHFETEL